MNTISSRLPKFAQNGKIEEVDVLPKEVRSQVRSAEVEAGNS